MVTQTVEFRSVTGVTDTAKLFTAGNDTEVASASATEATNRKGTYSAAFTDVAAGEYMLLALSSGTPVASWWVTLTLATATFQVYDRGNAPTAEAIADAVLDEATSGHQTAGTVGKALTDAATVTITPLSAGDIQRVIGTKIQLYRGEAITHTISSITDANGDEVNLTGKTLTVIIDRIKGSSHPDFETVSATVLSAASVSFTNTILSSSITGSFRWSLREPSNGDYVWARGTWEVLDTATED